MVSESKTKLLTELLSLTDVKVTSSQNLPQIGLILQTETLSKKAECTRCGNKSLRIHQNHRYLIKDLPISGQAVYLEINRRQFKCQSCQKPFSEELNFVKKRRKYTSRLAKEMVRQVVADRFNVMKQVNDELDEQRKTQKREAKKEKSPKKKSKILACLSKSKYALLKNECNLNEKQQLKLKEVKEVCPTLAKMHEFKEKFREIFESKQTGLRGLLKIGDWLKEAVTYYSKSKKTIVRWIGEIIAYFDERVTNGVVEGINNKLKLIKRSAYGFRNFDNFRNRVLLTWQFNY